MSPNVLSEFLPIRNILSPQNMYQYILFQALDEMPAFPKSNGQRGRLKAD